LNKRIQGLCGRAGTLAYFAAAGKPGAIQEMQAIGQETGVVPAGPLRPGGRSVPGSDTTINYLVLFHIFVMWQPGPGVAILCL